VLNIEKGAQARGDRWRRDVRSDVDDIGAAKPCRNHKPFKRQTSDFCKSVNQGPSIHMDHNFSILERAREVVNHKHFLGVLD
jgi:hypothetical protein